MNKKILALVLSLGMFSIAAPALAQYGGGAGSIPGVSFGPAGFSGSGSNSSNSSSNSNTGGEVLGAEAHQFTTNLSFGMKGSEVEELQKALIAAGFDIPLITQSHVPYGYFGSQTLAAVKAFQKAHGIEQTGFVGPLTRAALNKGTVSLQTQKQNTAASQSLWSAWESTRAY